MSQLLYSINQMRIAAANLRFALGGEGGIFQKITKCVFVLILEYGIQLTG